MKKILSIILAFIPLFFASCKNSKDESQKQVINYTLENEPLTLDPQTSTDNSSNIVITNIFEGLTRLNKKNEASPGVAKSWQSSENYDAYKFYLREDSTWNDKEKTPLTAHDFVFAVQRAISKDTNCKNIEDLFCIKNARKVNTKEHDISELGVKALDDYTLLIELEYSYEDFPKLVSTPPFMPCNKNFFTSTAGQYGRDFDKILSNGPFKMNNKYAWIHYENLTISTDPNYNGPNKPNCAGIEFLITKDMSEPIKLIQDKKIDVAKVSLDQLNKSDTNNINITSFKSITWGLCFNLKDNFFENDNIRDSFISAINRENIVSSIPDRCEEAKNIILDTLEVNGHKYRHLAGDCTLPSEEIQRAVQKMNSGLQEGKLKKPPDITILCLDDNKVKSIVSKLIENWNATFNIYINMKPLSKEDLENKISSGEYQMALYNIKSYSNDALSFIKIFKSDNNYNFANLNDTMYDTLLNSALSASLLEEKVTLLSQLETFLIDKHVFYPIYNESEYFACSSNVQDVLFNPYSKEVDFTKAKKTKH